jgi:hypothetical protein
MQRVFISTKDSGGKDVTHKQLPAPVQADEILELARRIEQVNGSDLQDIQRLRELLAGLPEDPFPDCSVTYDIQAGLIGKLGQGIHQVFLRAEADRLKRDLGYTASPQLEQLLIDHILTLRLQLLHAEKRYNDTVVNSSATVAAAAYQDKHLSACQSRYLKAVEMLAKVRRLARNTPSLQINIAQDGGKQINVQGEVGGEQGL